MTTWCRNNHAMMTLEDHAAAWWQECGVNYWAHGPTDRANLYETWIDCAWKGVRP